METKELTDIYFSKSFLMLVNKYSTDYRSLGEEARHVPEQKQCINGIH